MWHQAKPVKDEDACPYAAIRDKVKIFNVQLSLLQKSVYISFHVYKKNCRNMKLYKK